MNNPNAQKAISTLQAAKEAVERRNRTLQERQEAESKIKKQLSGVDEEGDAVASSSGCGVCTLLFGRRSKYAVPLDVLKRNKATTELQKAVDELQKRTEALQERILQARASASTLNASGKKTEALSALRRSKTLEKQLASSQNALETLEGQLLMLEEAKLQSQISSALSASTGAVGA